MLVRDIHPPKTSQLKKDEMKHLINRVQNNRIFKDKNKNHLKDSRNYDTNSGNLSHALKNSRVGRSTEGLSSGIKLNHIRKNLRPKKKKNLSYNNQDDFTPDK